MAKLSLPRRTAAALVALALVVAGLATGAVVALQHRGKDSRVEQAGEQARERAGEQGEEGEEGDGDSAEERAHERHNAAGEAGEESEAMRTAFEQFRDARNLGLLKDPGAYSDAFQ